ncbi:NIPSNAP family protein [Paenibacillus sepulcri]|uniref:NIPSNAP family protein n=1 Tax=Paenibacillus sepulcri TaxID=359917 RepID=A0ABS7BX90_9BACL|nr:NIPSNAP family protein [Paenibacillus sepulcri]
MLYELRIYSVHAGKMEAMNARFANHTIGIFKRLGMKVYDFWVDQEGHSKLYYIMEYNDMDERNRQWDVFGQDPEWLEVKQKSEADGPIVEQVEKIFMQRAGYFQR